jgi:putative tryptophan/tyrosine transport system substrate-binding protein
VEGQNIVIEGRYAEGKVDRLPELAAELTRLKVDIIVSGGPTVTLPAKYATATIPIVMALDDDPVGSGFVASLARPGGNITGLSTLAPEISGKQLELLKEIVPNLTRVAVIGNSTRAGTAQMLKETELAAEALRVQLQSLEVRDLKDIVHAFREASKGRADAVLVLTSPVFLSQRTRTAALAVKSRLPATYPWPENVEDGGLMHVQREHYRLVPARRNVCRQDTQGRKTRRPPGKAAEEVRVHHQSQSSEADRPDDFRPTCWRGRIKSSDRREP